MGRLHLTYPANIAKVTSQKRRFNLHGLGLLHLPFLILYVFALKACVETSGNPYAVALAHHKEKGYDPAAFDAKTAASAQRGKTVVDDWGGGDAEDDPWGDLEADEEHLAPDAPDAAAAVEASSTAPDAAEAPAPANLTALEEQIKYETPPALPASWLRSSGRHLLLRRRGLARPPQFGQHWSVRFRGVNYVEADEVKPGNALMRPMPHQGKAEIVDVRARISDPKAPGGRRKMLWTVFQRQRFEYVTTEVGGDGKVRGEVREVQTPVAEPLASYLQPTRGMSAGGVAASTSRFGDNSLRVPLPTFLKCYKEQLMSPVCVFQVFTTLLWLLDEYWKYALFSQQTCHVQAATAFSRIKNIRHPAGRGRHADANRRVPRRQMGVRSSEEPCPGYHLRREAPGGGDSPSRGASC